jgi:ELWxxDGT repeat protein
MRKTLCLTLLAVGLFISLSGASAAEQTLSSGISLFAASDEETGLELWRSDGTSRGTFRLTDDACNEFCEQFNTLSAPWINAGNRAFVLSQGFADSALWVTDGSRAGTFPIYAGKRIWSLEPPVWVKGLRLLFFAVNDPSTYDFELWRSDGTVEGTRKIQQFVSADTRGGIRELTAFQGRAFFNGQDALHGAALWSSDGTEAGTVLVRDFARDEEGAGPTWLRAVGSRLVFFASTPDDGAVLWASDGTRAGSEPILDLQPGLHNYPSVDAARVVGGVLLLSAAQQLWASDGTRAGTRSLASFSEPPALSQPSLFKGRYFFEGTTAESGLEIWSTDGTPAGTRMLADVCPGGCSGIQETGTLAAVGDRLLFAGNDGVHGIEPWQSDGRLRGTRLVRDLVFDGPSSPGLGHVVAEGRIVFPAYRTLTTPRQLWRTDGTSRGTVRLTDFVEAGVTDQLLWEIPGAVLFRVVSESGKDELWVSDGTRPGTRRLKTIRAGG